MQALGFGKDPFSHTHWDCLHVLKQQDDPAVPVEGTQQPGRWRLVRQRRRDPYLSPVDVWTVGVRRWSDRLHEGPISITQPQTSGNPRGETARLRDRLNNLATKTLLNGVAQIDRHCRPGKTCPDRWRWSMLTCRLSVRGGSDHSVHLNMIPTGPPRHKRIPRPSMISPVGVHGSGH